MSGVGGSIPPHRITCEFRKLTRAAVLHITIILQGVNLKMERMQLTQVSGLAVPVQLSNYRAEGAKLYCQEAVSYTHLTLPTNREV